MTLPQFVIYDTSFAATAYAGISQLSSAPVSPTVPIAVGKNDWAGTANQGIGYMSTSPASSTFPILVGKNDYAATANLGLVFLSSSPVTASDPIAVGKNDFASTVNYGVVRLAISPVSGSDPVAVGSNQTIATTAPLTGGGNLTAGLTISMAAATASVDGYLTGADWTIFNNKIGEAPVDGIVYGRQNNAWVAATPTYTNLNQIVSALGGVQVGDTFPTQPIQDVLDKLLYPYQAPTFASFLITGQTTILQVGDTSNADPSFAWTLTSTSNITANSIGIVDTTAAETLVTGHSITSPATITHVGITKTTASSEVYTITGTNTHGATFSRTFTITWRWLVFYGESATTPLAEADIEGLRVGGLQSGFAGTYAFVAGAGQYKYLSYPSSMGTATSFKDQSTNLDVPFETVYTVSVTNGFGVATNYNVHRTTNAIGSAINIVVA